MSKQCGPTSWNLTGTEQHETIDLIIDAEAVEAFTRDNSDILKAIAVRLAEYVKHSDAASLHLFSNVALRMINLTNHKIKLDLLEKMKHRKNLQ